MTLSNSEHGIIWEFERWGIYDGHPDSDFTQWRTVYGGATSPGWQPYGPTKNYMTDGLNTPCYGPMWGSIGYTPNGMHIVAVYQWRWA
jgi:hypothetical protein